MDFAPYASLFHTLYAASRAVLPGLAHTPSLIVCIHRTTATNNLAGSLPAVPLRLEHLIARLQTAYQLTTKAKFADAVDRFRSIMLAVPLLLVENNTEEAEAKSLINICKEYIIGLQMEMARKSLPKESDKVTQRLPIFILFNYLKVVMKMKLFRSNNSACEKFSQLALHN